MRLNSANANLLLFVLTCIGMSSCTFTDSPSKDNNRFTVARDGVFIKSAKIIRKSTLIAGDAAPALPSTIADNAFLLKESKWYTHILPVCWESLAESTASDRELVMSSIKSSWSANSSLQFVGWQECPSSEFNGIRIKVEDSGPHTKGLGRYLMNKKNGMVLNFTFENWSPSCQNQRQQCINSIAVHEFGHALGFAHEQNRPDTPGECLEPPQGTDGNMMLTSWDPNSVMNYCNSRYNNNGELSELDKLALESIYK